MKISIITTTHNSASTIRDTLDSIFAQTYQDWELIIEDGLSQDNTLSIIREYEQKSNGRIHVYSEKDEGLYDAMNRGIRHSTGEIIGVLNSDDFYYDEYVLEDINRAMEGQPVDCIYGNLKYVSAKDKNITERIWKGSQYKREHTCMVGILHIQRSMHVGNAIINTKDSIQNMPFPLTSS